MSFGTGLKTIVVATDLDGRADAAMEYARKLAVAYGARSVQQKAALARQEKRVHDAQHAIERVRIDGLADAPVRGRRIPLGTKIPARHQPLAGIPRHAHIFVAVCFALRYQLNFKIESGIVCRADVTRVAFFNK